MGDWETNLKQLGPDGMLRHLLARYADLEEHAGGAPLFEQEPCPYRGKCPHVAPPPIEERGTP